MSVVKKTLRAFCVAPLGALAVYAALLLFDPLDGQGAVAASLAVLASVLVVGYVAEAAVAWPALIVLTKFGLVSPAVCIAGGLALALVLASVLDLPNLNLARWHYYAAAGLSGFCSGAVFAFSFFSRPNKR